MSADPHRPDDGRCTAEGVRVVPTSDVSKCSKFRWLSMIMR
jgi:hypothetical protein